MTDNRTTELLPCPFCGGEAELKHYQSGDWQVVCYHADGCIMRESDLDNCYWENVQTLARQWNTRAELGRLNATSSQEPIVRSFLRKISPNRDWDYLGEHEHAMIADLVDDIAATLGSGTLTAEQVREVIERNFGKVAVLDDGEPVEWRDDWVCKVGINYKAIADELNAELGSGTCEENEPDGWHKCDECGCVVGYWLLVDDSWTIYMDDYQIPFNNCPNCGRKVTQ